MNNKVYLSEFYFYLLFICFERESISQGGEERESENPKPAPRSQSSLRQGWNPGVMRS